MEEIPHHAEGLSAAGRGQKLWGSRFGKLTSIRLHGATDGFAGQLRAALDPAGAWALPSSRRARRRWRRRKGATDFGEYFVYFSFFLMVSALLLAALFFRLGIEQRMREIGMFRAMGFPAAAIRKLFLMEGGALALAGCVGGDCRRGRVRRADHARSAHALVGRGRDHAAFAARRAIGAGYRKRWRESPSRLLCIWWTLRGLRPITPRGLLAAAPDRNRRRPPGWVSRAPPAGIALLVAARWIGAAGSFFGGGTLLLAAALFEGRAWLGRRGTARAPRRFPRWASATPHGGRAAAFCAPR